MTALKRAIEQDDLAAVAELAAAAHDEAVTLLGHSYGAFVALQNAVDYPGMAAQLLIQAKAVGIVVVWTAVVAAISFYIVKALFGLRVTEDEEREGLDLVSHGERAYDL